MIALSLFISGCGHQPDVHTVRAETVKCECPKFNTKLSIRVEDLNSTHGAISWGDVGKIESFLKSKKRFNAHVDKINKIK